MNQTSRTTGYNLFCKELNSEEGVRLLTSKQKFVLYGSCWAALTTECRREFRRRAAQKNTLSHKQRQGKWNKCVKKMLKVMDEMRSLQPTSGYFVVVPQGGDPRYGGTQSGNIFIENEYEAVVEGFCKGLDARVTAKTSITVHDIRQLFNSKYAEAVGQPGKKLPYKTLFNLQMDGLPEGIVFKKPQCYGTAQLRRIWNARESIKCIVKS
ncbi:uncharacterized protein [Apostichopus japonicus]|uniref:uncharacterized protein n=1 Tax=Stichopus japonicus TaxID=307972 RepID=UPI003AB5E8B1